MSLILDGTNGISDVDGSASTPAIRGTDANTGVFFGSDTVGVSTGGSERMIVDSSGNVGIGTSSPAGKLGVSDGTVQIVTAPFAAGFTGYIGTSTNHALAVLTNNTERMRIDSSGNVYIGGTVNTTSLGRFLTVQQAGFSSTGITVGSYSATPGSVVSIIESLGERSDGNQTFGGRHGAAYRRSDGTAISSGTSIGYYAFGGQWGTDTSYQSAKLLYAASIVGIAEGSFTASNAMATGIAFRTGSTGESLSTVNTGYGTERMRIDSSGNVGIGTTSPAQRLDVKSSGVGFEINPNSSGNAIIAAFNRNTIDFSPAVLQGSTIRFDTGAIAGNTERMRIDSSGRVTMPYQPAFFATGTGGSINVAAGSYFPFNALNTSFASSARNVGYNTSTFLYTAPVAGLYMFYVQLYVSTAISTSWWKNGAQLSSGTDTALVSFNNNTNTYMYNGSIIIELAAGDFIGTQPRTGSSTQAIYMGHSTFWGVLVG